MAIDGLSFFAKSNMSVDWSQLPQELLETITKNLTIYTDYLRFRAVCQNWRSSVPKIALHLPPQLPWLMLPLSQSLSRQSHRAFFNLSENKVHFLNLPEASHRRRRCGSSHGWLALLDETPNILLLNPLTRAKVDLPPLTTFPNVVSFCLAEIGREYVLRDSSGDLSTLNLREMRDSFLRKVFLSSSPVQDNNFMAVAILDQTGDLAYCRNGDRSWTFIDDARCFSEDVIFHNGLFYAVDKEGAVAVCDVRVSSPRVSIIQTPRQYGGDMQYLVSSGDELLLVTRFLDLEFDVEPYQSNLIYRTTRFEVSRLNWDGPGWEKVRCLGDRMLFLGGNSSLSLSASDFRGCMGNCIYYTDDYSESNYEGSFAEHDLGIFKLGDGSIEPLPCYPRNSHSRLCWPPPVWVTPNPC